MARPVNNPGTRPGITGSAPTRVTTNTARIYGCEHCRKNIPAGEEFRPSPAYAFCNEDEYKLWKLAQAK